MAQAKSPVFDFNLELTKAFCRQQTEGEEKTIAKVFRSYNPIVNGNPLFTFKVENYGYEIMPGVTQFLTTNWSVDPIISSNTIDELFNKQLNYKKRVVTDINITKSDLGKILVAEIDVTVVDGASETVSQGMIDVYDLPPIDTWVYLQPTPKGRFLYAFIPEAFISYVNEAIAVNCVDCLYWLKN